MSKPAAAAVAANLRAEVARQRLPQTALAEVLGLSVSAVSRRMSGEIPLDVEELAKVAALLGVPTSVLLEPAA